jgi:hypothetical protein
MSHMASKSGVRGIVMICPLLRMVKLRYTVFCVMIKFLEEDFLIDTTLVPRGLL